MDVPKKTLVLIRHAKSSRNQTQLRDFERPLNPRGRKDAPEMGRRLASRGLQPAGIISSPAVRARETANAIAEALDFPPGRIVWEPEIYEATPDTLLLILRRQSDHINPLILVGHNPGLTELANALTHDSLENLPTAGAYTVQLPIQHWHDIQCGIGQRVALETPPKTAPRD